jgi:hypothetical protein
MILNNIDVAATCTAIKLDGTTLYFNCAISPSQVSIIVLPQTDPDYQEALSWATSSGKLNS